MTLPQAFDAALEHHQAGRLAEAEAIYRQILAVQPSHAEALHFLGVIAHQVGRHLLAVDCIRQAIVHTPNNPAAHSNLGEAWRTMGRPDKAIAAFRRALELQPDYAQTHNNLGNALRDRGELDEAIAAYRRALELKPDYAGAHSNLVFALRLHPGRDRMAIVEEHQRWNRKFSDPLKSSLQPHPNDRHPERRLRVGYVSPDFRDHAVGRYILPLLEHHDRTKFEILCYSGVPRPDWMTERLRALAGLWRNSVGVSDTRLAEMIREDAVDILVDLSMHTPDNRLPVFARQPAPVQVTWLAYPGGAGLPGIGYRLTDARIDPPERDSVFSSEEPVRLPGCWCCYRPVNESPEINELPALSANGVTFGSLNNFAKAPHSVLALWARVLEAVKGSRLVMLCPEGSARVRVRAFFDARGIAAERVEFVRFVPWPEYLSLYQRIDIGLDPFPYNGMTTTCDALWMGVPVLTLPGELPVSRAGLSLLSTVGLSEFAATSEEDYIRMAAKLATSLPRLANLRATLRPRMQASPLMDAPRFAQNLEAAYRSMWQAWCLGKPRKQ